MTPQELPESICCSRIHRSKIDRRKWEFHAPTSRRKSNQWDSIRWSTRWVIELIDRPPSSDNYQEFMDFYYLAKVTGINLATIANLAFSPPPPTNVQLITTLSNLSTLQWSPPSYGPQVAGYFVLRRETHRYVAWINCFVYLAINGWCTQLLHYNNSPVWQWKQLTTLTTMTLPYSKDNFFFAVQSIDIMGHESLPVFPSAASDDREIIYWHRGSTMLLLSCLYSNTVFFHELFTNLVQSCPEWNV